MNAYYRYAVLLLLLAVPSLALADLEWITGETPKATNDKPASTRRVKTVTPSPQGIRMWW